MKLSFRKSFFNYQVLRQMSYLGMGAGEPGEFLYALDNIKSGNVESWTQEWQSAADRSRALADEYLMAQNNRSAKQALLAASNYYWLAEFFQPLYGRREDDLGTILFEKMQEAYRKALKLWDTPVEGVKVPYEGVDLDAYFFTPSSDNTPRPTIIAIGGFDSTLEVEVCGMFSEEATARGYNLLAFEGPGQGAVLRTLGLPNRFDYEVPISAAVDYLLTRPDVDPDNIILIGSSFGGYYSARAAAFEHRLKALIVHSALFAVRDMLPGPILASRTIAKMGTWLLLKDQDFKLISDKLRAVYGYDSLVDLITHYKKFDLSEVAPKIQCPTFVIHGAQDDLVPVSQAEKLFAHLTCEKELHIAEGPASLHCQVGNFSYASAQIFGWLEAKLNGEKPGAERGERLEPV